MDFNNLGIIGDLGAEGVQVKAEDYEVKQINYMDFVQHVNSFISLDISKTSTGWVRWYEGVLTKGAFSLDVDKHDRVKARHLFREKVKEVFNGAEVDYMFIEEPIGSVNFETARILYQLNEIPDDMVFYGDIKAKEIIREGNGEWKAPLRELSGYKAPYRGFSDEKAMIRECMRLVGFGDGTEDEIIQDTYDAMGMAIGSIYRRLMKKDVINRKIKKDITKGFVVKQFDDLYQALDAANETNLYVTNLDFSQLKRDLKYNFKMHIESTQDDTAAFVITIPTQRIGALALNKNFNLEWEMSYLLAYRK